MKNIINTGSDQPVESQLEELRGRMIRAELTIQVLKMMVGGIAQFTDLTEDQFQEMLESATNEAELPNSIVTFEVNEDATQEDISLMVEKSLAEHKGEVQ
jgi:hypothetical protein